MFFVEKVQQTKEMYRSTVFLSLLRRIGEGAITITKPDIRYRPTVIQMKNV